MALVLAVSIALSTPAKSVLAASFSPADLRLLSRVIAFLQPPLTPGAFVAIAYMPGNGASRLDAEAIAASLGDSIKAGTLSLPVRLVDLPSLGMGGFSVVIAAAGTNLPQLGAASHAAHVLCVSRDAEAVRAGNCSMAITSEPKVEILVNHAVTMEAGIDFQTAFRMMIREM